MVELQRHWYCCKPAWFLHISWCTVSSCEVVHKNTNIHPKLLCPWWPPPPSCIHHHYHHLLLVESSVYPAITSSVVTSLIGQTRRQCQPASQLWHLGTGWKEEEKSLSAQLSRTASECRCSSLSPAVTRLRLIRGGISPAPQWCASITCNHFQSLFPLNTPPSLFSLCVFSLCRGHLN